jgi:lysophospholipid acyltransferase (LPLAT)-like uncharacterized protein
MKINLPILNKLGGLLAAKGVGAWMETLDYKVAYYDYKIDPVFPECRGQKIYLFWHEYILFPFYLRGHCNMAMLLSRHTDAEILSHAAYHRGFDFVRGSTNRGGVTALRELLAKSIKMHLTITPDGPRGPRRVMAPGAIFLASKLGMPIVAREKSLGPIRHPASLHASESDPQRRNFHPPQSRPRRHRILPP